MPTRLTMTLSSTELSLILIKSSLRRLSTTWKSSWESVLTTERQCLLYYPSPVGESMTTLEQSRPCPKQFRSTQSTSRPILLVDKSIFSRGNLTKHYKTSLRSSTTLLTTPWAISVTLIVWRVSRGSRKQFNLTQKSLKLSLSLGVRASWREVCYTLNSRTMSKLWLTLTSWLRWLKNKTMTFYQCR